MTSSASSSAGSTSARQPEPSWSGTRLPPLRHTAGAGLQPAFRLAASPLNPTQTPTPALKPGARLPYWAEQARHTERMSTQPPLDPHTILNTTASSYLPAAGSGENGQRSRQRGQEGKLNRSSPFILQEGRPRGQGKQVKVCCKEGNNLFSQSTRNNTRLRIRILRSGNNRLRRRQSLHQTKSLRTS